MKITNTLPVSFRGSEAEKIMTAIRAGESCTVVGIGSVGKSNLLRFLCQENVRQAKLGEQWDKYLFIYVDANKLLQLSQWGLFELMLHQLLKDLSQHDRDKPTAQEIDKLHQRILNSENQHLALRYLDRALGIICMRLGFRVVLLIDEFDELCRELPDRAFAALRAMRDDYKYLLMYVVATRRELTELREASSGFEAFEEVVTPNTVWLGSYSEADARLMLQRLAARHKITLEENRTQDIITKTGGHPGLIRSTFPLLLVDSHSSLQELVADKHVQDESQRIWRSLSFDEQKTFISYANEQEPASSSAETINRLKLKGLVGGPWTGPNEIFSPLFAEFIRQEKPVIGARLLIDHVKRMVLVDDVKIQDLTPLEFRFIDYLEQHSGQVCSRHDLALQLYPDDVPNGGVSNNRIDSIAKRVRQKIDLDPGKASLIETVRGIGFKLIDGESLKE